MTDRMTYEEALNELTGDVLDVLSHDMPRTRAEAARGVAQQELDRTLAARGYDDVEVEIPTRYTIGQRVYSFHLGDIMDEGDE